MAKAQLFLLLAVLLGPVGASAADPQLKIVEFTAAVCEPCKRMQPVISKLVSEGWDIRQLDVADQRQLVERFQIKSVPTIVLLRDGAEVDRVVGALGYEKLRARFERAAGAPTTVRGQSPAINAFPMLGASTFGSLQPSAAGNVREMTEAPAASVEPLSQLQHGQLQANQLQHSQAAAAPRSSAGPSAEAIAIAGAATVRIRIDETNALSFGTGTVISVHGEQALVLTCGHLFRDIKPDAKLSVDVYHAGRPINVPATVVTFNAKEYDLGLIEFRMPVPITPVRVAPLSAQPQVGDVAFSFGCDRGADPSRRDTQIKRINRYLGAANVEIHGAPVVGRSGGGLFDAQGQLIGVCNAADEEDNEGIYAALPIVHEHIAHLNLKELDGASPTALANAATGRAAVPAAMAQLASSSTRATSAAVAEAPAASGHASTAGHRAATGAPGYWPDQHLPENRPVGTAAPAQVRCVIRDAAGVESMLTIDQPSEALVAMLRQHAQR